MTEKKPGVYLIIEFEWPPPAEFKPEHGQKARNLHDTVQDKDWIREIMAASGGIGEGASSIWVFWLKDYASLDRLMFDKDDEVAKAYSDFFSEMPHIVDMIRHEVIFV